MENSTNSDRRYRHRPASGVPKLRTPMFESLESRRLLIVNPFATIGMTGSTPAGDAFAAVGILTGGQGSGTGTLVSSQYVLTAAHIAEESNLVFTTDDGTQDPITNRYIWQPYYVNGADAQRDMAIVELKNPIDNIPPLPIAVLANYPGSAFIVPSSGLGQAVGDFTNTVIVGYGETGKGVNDAGTKRMGFSVFGSPDPFSGDSAIFSLFGTAAVANSMVLTTPVPYNQLSITDHGDSGGPALELDTAGGYAIVGVTSDGNIPMDPTYVVTTGNYSEDTAVGGLTTSPFPFVKFTDPSIYATSDSFLFGGGLLEDYPTVLASTFVGVGDATVTVASNDIRPATLPVLAGESSVHANVVQLEGSSLQPFADFTDPGGSTNPGDFTAEINWGDGSSVNPDVTKGTISAPDSDGVFTVDGAHAYTDFGQFSVTVTVEKNAGGPPVAFNESITVYEAPLLVTGGLSLTGTYGTGVNGVDVATFTDPGGLAPNPLASTYTALITWGGSGTANAVTTTGTITEIGSSDQYEVTGSYTYFEQTDSSPDYTISVEVYRDVAGQDPTQTANPDPAPVTVTDTAILAYPKLVGMGKSIEVVQRVDSGEQPLAAFTDPGQGENVHEYSASINWGDGTPVDTATVQISGPSNAGVYTVDGDHSYVEPGKYTITIDLNHLTAPTDVVMPSATILQNIGMLLLDRTSAGAFLNSGNGRLTITGNGDLVIDSDSATAAIQSGNGNVSAIEIDAVGKLTHSGSGNYVDSVVGHPAATPDPLAALGIVPPSASAIGLHTYAAVKVTSSQSVTLNPGVYAGGISVSGSAKVVLNPGVYILSGGGLSMTGNAVLSGSDVMIYNAPSRSGGQISISGSAQIMLTAPSPNSPSATRKPFETEFQGIALFQDPTSIIPIQVSGNASFNITGVIYAAKSALTMSSTANSFVQGDLTKLLVSAGVVVDDFLRSGNGSLTINAAANQSLNIGPILGQPMGTGTATVAILKAIQTVPTANTIVAPESLTTVTNVSAFASTAGSGITSLNPGAVDVLFDEIGTRGLELN